MERRIHFPIPLWIVAALSFQVAVGAAAEPYRWRRTFQELTAVSTLTANAQGTPQTQTFNPGPTSSSFIATVAQAEITRPALGGGDGDGGDSGFLLFMAEPGDDGQDGDPVPGADGGGDQHGGAGGQPGANGAASASGTALCIDETNLDFEPALSYSWIHNQWGDLSLQAAGGSGGGGGDSGGWFHDPEEGLFIFGGAGGGAGGAGQNARGTVNTTQVSGVDLQAVWDLRPDWTGPPPNPVGYPCDITLDMGWISAPNPDWINELAPWAPIWVRNINLFIVAGETSVWITVDNAGFVTASGVDDFGVPFFEQSAAAINANSGSFGLGPGEVGQTIIFPGETAQIFVPQGGINSTFAGAMTAAGGSGGGGGGGGGVPENGGDGGNGPDGGAGGGALGGNGGAGGAGDSADLDGDGIIDIVAGAGGRGGKGGAGQGISEHLDGIYQGVVVIEVR
jgi:hypothetical protein